MTNQYTIIKTGQNPKRPFDIIEEGKVVMSCATTEQAALMVKALVVQAEKDRVK